MHGSLGKLDKCADELTVNSSWLVLVWHTQQGPTAVFSGWARMEMSLERELVLSGIRLMGTGKIGWGLGELPGTDWKTWGVSWEGADVPEEARDTSPPLHSHTHQAHPSFYLTWTNSPFKQPLWGQDWCLQHILCWETDERLYNNLASNSWQSSLPLLPQCWDCEHVHHAQLEK